MKIRTSFISRVLAFMTVFGLAAVLASCSSEENIQSGNTDTDTDNDKNLTAFVTGAEPTSRTSMDYNTGAFYWEAGDYIYVLDDNDVWRKSNNAPTAKTAYFKFKVPGRFSARSSYKVFYPGKNAWNNEVPIRDTQTQETPNSTAHFGTVGDCGTANATKITGKAQFEFKLDHQAAILVFLPYTTNTILQNCRLTKIEVTSDKSIAGSFTLDPVTGELTNGGYSKNITLTTKGSGSYAEGFPLNITSANIATNGAYMVIKPGTHTLKVRYWVKDLVTNVEGAITKVYNSFNYKKNTYYDMAINLNVKDYSGDRYYMWDAQDQYWNNYEWTHNNPAWQPTLNDGSPGATTSTFYPQNNTDSRWYNEGWSRDQFEATRSCAIAPNGNELVWYCEQGDPRWDGNELWTTMGHLYKGGVWFLKKAYINGFSTEYMPGMYQIDMRKSTYHSGNNRPSSTLPSASEASHFFYLPALGFYQSGKLMELGSTGYYWSSTAGAYNGTGACGLLFHSTTVYAGYYGTKRSDGFRVQAFE